MGDDQLTQMLLMYAGTIFLFFVKNMSFRKTYATNASKWLAKTETLLPNSQNRLVGTISTLDPNRRLR